MYIYTHTYIHTYIYQRLLTGGQTTGQHTFPPPFHCFPPSPSLPCPHPPHPAAPPTPLQLDRQSRNETALWNVSARACEQNKKKLTKTRQTDRGGD